MAKGWIKLHRQLMDNELWNEKPYDRTHAWIDMIFMANIEDKDMLLRHLYNSVRIERGSFFTSYRHLADRWGWSVNKVKRYLDYLAVHQMVTLSGTPNGTLVCLVKYGVYQDKRNTDGHSDGHTDGYSDGYSDGSRLKNIYKNNIKNIKEGKNDAPFVAKTPDEIDALFEKMRKEGAI